MLGILVGEILTNPRSKKTEHILFEPFVWLLLVYRPEYISELNKQKKDGMNDEEKPFLLEELFQRL